MADFLNLTPGGPVATLTSLCAIKVSKANYGIRVSRLTYLQRAHPSLSTSRRSPEGSGSPRALSIQDLASFAAAGEYFSRRILRKSLSKDVTEAIVTRILENVRNMAREDCRRLVMFTVSYMASRAICKT